MQGWSYSFCYKNFYIVSNSLFIYRPVHSKLYNLRCWQRRETNNSVPQIAVLEYSIHVSIHEFYALTETKATLLLALKTLLFEGILSQTNPAIFKRYFYKFDFLFSSICTKTLSLKRLI